MNPLIYNSENLHVNCKVIFSKLKLNQTQAFHLYVVHGILNLRNVSVGQTHNATRQTPS